MATTPDGRGYWLVASDGGIFDYGDAGFYGSTGGIHLNRPIVGMATTPDGTAIGWWPPTVGSSPTATPILRLDRRHAAEQTDRGDGPHPRREGLLAGGLRRWHLQLRRRRLLWLDRGHPLNRPIVGMATTPDGNGYWLVASDGGIFNYGDAVFYGSTGSDPPEPAGRWHGHHLRRQGRPGRRPPSMGNFNYGDTAFYGSMAG